MSLTSQHVERLKTKAVLSNDEYEAGLASLMLTYLGNNDQTLHVSLYYIVGAVMLI